MNDTPTNAEIRKRHDFFEDVREKYGWGKLLNEVDEHRGILLDRLEAANSVTLELVVTWAMRHGFATGHADTLQDLLCEVGSQVEEIRDKSNE